MSSIWSKLDSGLSSIYFNYLQVKERGTKGVAHVHPIVAGGGRLNVTMHYTGDLAEIEELGFKTIWNDEEGWPEGTIDLENLERLAAHPGVQMISHGGYKCEPMLDDSIPDIRADQVWTFAGGTFSDTTGAGVIVGIIDTGIDFRHPHFLKGTVPETTRILRIWDPGLEVVAGESPPPAALLTGPTYGVEYTEAMINDVLQGVAGATPVRHRDCDGHGTHVASIAAGNGRVPFNYIGVAPEADLIIVKYFDYENEPKSGVPATAVGYGRLFKDAVTYIRNVANSFVPSRPVVINYSFTDNTGPHDGFTDDEDWLTHTYTGATGDIFVTASGNSAETNQHARIKFPAAGGTVDIPFELYDRRGAKRKEFRGCKWVLGTKDLYIVFYYPAAGPEISVELDIPNDGTGFISGPAHGGAPVNGTFGGREYTMKHGNHNITLRGGRGVVLRRYFEIEIKPFRNRHRVGNYSVRVTSPGAHTFHMWCSRDGYSRGHGFEVDTSAPLTPIVNMEDRFLIGSPGGADNVITAAAYNAEVPGLDIAHFSSTGPLVSYGGIPPQPDKPDLAAPGVNIDAAKSIHAKPWGPIRTTPMNGTSMAAPHVTGTVALMFEKNSALTVAQVMHALTNRARNVPPVPPTPPVTSHNKVGAGRLDAKNAYDDTP